MLALITGASAGIGLELARCFAADGHDLILVARRVEKLEEIASELTQKHDIKAHVFPSDLGVPGAAHQLFEAIDARGHRIAALVNNAGIGQSGEFASSDLDTLSTMLHLNVVALTELTRSFLPTLLEQERGYILNVGSTAGFQPGPGMAVYYASKAYVNSFSDALVEELKDTRVSITNLAPGATDTEFQERADVADAVLFAAGVMTSREVAQAGYAAMLSGTSLHIPGLKNKVGAKAAAVVPRALMRKIISKVNSKTS